MMSDIKRVKEVPNTKKTRLLVNDKSTPEPKLDIPSISAAPLSESDLKAVNEVSVQTQLEYAKKVKAYVGKVKSKEIEDLDVIVKEYVGPYVLIGYDLNGEPFEVVSAQSPAEYDALVERFKRVYQRLQQNLINTDGHDPFGVLF